MGTARSGWLLPLLPPLDASQAHLPTAPLPCPDYLNAFPPVERPPDRDDLINRAIIHLRPLGSGRSSSPVVILWGESGMGKTTLARWLVQFYRADYPDACLIAQLRSETSAWSRGLTLKRWLQQLGENDSATSVSGLPELEARWQASLMERKAIVLLETDCPPQQWRPLIPRSPACIAIVTTPYPPSTELPESLSLGVLPLTLDQATAQFAHATRPELPASPQKASTMPQTLSPWGGIPLAMGLARVIIQQHQAGESQEPAAALGKDGWPQSQIHPKYPAVSGSFALVYRQLSPPAQALLRRLALLPAPLLNSSLASVLVETDQPVQEVVDDLVTHQCLEAIGPGAYKISHDLIRLLAKSYLATEDNIDTRHHLRLAIGRWYAEALLHIGWRHRPNHPFRPQSSSTVDLPPLAGSQNGWLEHHWPNLALVWEWLQQEHDQSALLRLSLGLSSALTEPLELDWWWPHSLQLLSPEPNPLDSQLLAYFKNNQANGLVYQGRVEEAIDFYQQGLATLRLEQDRLGQVYVLANLGSVYGLQQLTDLHLQCWRQALEALPGDDCCHPFLQNWMLNIHKDMAQIAIAETGTAQTASPLQNRSWNRWIRQLFQ